MTSRTGPLLRCVVAIGVVLTTSGCLTGERPSFEDESSAPESTSGNADIDTVLGLLDSVDRARFTAGYRMETKFNSVSSTGLVVQDTGQRRSITVDNPDRTVRFVIDGPDVRTCDLIAEACEASINDARISDTQLSHTFYGPAFAKRLRADADRRIGDPTLYETSIAAEPAVCVDVTVAGGTKTYCALESGPLARFVGPDVTIDLTSYTSEPDTTKFAST